MKEGGDAFHSDAYKAVERAVRAATSQELVHCSRHLAHFEVKQWQLAYASKATKNAAIAAVSAPHTERLSNADDGLAEENKRVEPKAALPSCSANVRPSSSITARPSTSGTHFPCTSATPLSVSYVSVIGADPLPCQCRIFDPPSLVSALNSPRRGQGPTAKRSEHSSNRLCQPEGKKKDGEEAHKKKDDLVVSQVKPTANSLSPTIPEATTESENNQLWTARIVAEPPFQEDCEESRVVTEEPKTNRLRDSSVSDASELDGPLQPLISLGEDGGAYWLPGYLSFSEQILLARECIHSYAQPPNSTSLDAQRPLPSENLKEGGKPNQSRSARSCHARRRVG
eukprot:GHVT01015314.1.p1 GENE.GHVT01015314.1~~GHVT01015314.1.p1  ORF type:complete len:341 (+),score=48.42 GHVT01015314.1:318-1340(+)